MKRVLVDVNVVLDVLMNRPPHADASARVWSLVEEGRVEGLLSAHAVTTIHCLNARGMPPKVAAETTEGLLSVFGVAAVDEVVLRRALGLRWKDFEDAVTASAAERARCAAIVTRNVRDFRRSPVRAFTPGETVAWLEAS